MGRHRSDSVSPAAAALLHDIERLRRDGLANGTWPGCHRLFEVCVDQVHELAPVPELCSVAALSTTDDEVQNRRLLPSAAVHRLLDQLHSQLADAKGVTPGVPAPLGALRKRMST